MRTLFALAFLLLASCDGETCTTEARSSVSLTVEDTDGQPVADATVTYAVDGGAPEACEAFPDGSFGCGWEEAGAFVIDVVAEGYADEQRTYDVVAGECHVESEVDTIVLGPVDCDAVVVPSVVAYVTDGTNPIDATVTWRITDTKMVEQPCERVTTGEYECADEQAGPLTITASDTLQNDIVEVVVEEDVCHVITEEVDLVLPPPE